MRHGYDGVVVTTPVTVPYQRFSPHAAHWWAGAALRGLAEASGIAHTDMDGLSVASFGLAPDSGISLTQHFGMSVRHLDTVPLGGASAVVSLRRAARAVQAGDADVVACIGADTNTPDSFRQALASFSRFAQDAVYPMGAGGANASFALLTRHYMRAFGATREDFARICIAQRDNALKNPDALMKTPLTLEQYMAARPVADPVHLFDCVMPCAGAEAFLVMREETARAQGIPFARLTAAIEGHNQFPGDPVQVRGGWARDVDVLYGMAGCGPEGIDVLQTYDDYPVIVMMQFEDLGFCAKGEGPAFVRSRDLRIEGDFPHNTSGGQLSVGQAGAAGGHLGLVEALRQVTGQAGARQVAKARRAMALGFGMINYDRGLASGAVILEAA
ncbi:thiolase family protein [Paracoccus fontiphilus]|uniref:Thiolase family protein n=1 Tax=Paracoccus fontiphilus TaxID=1815556 RepID=A0ABV7IB02_9RHOB|nr:thiolase family protein [Paracoccus fontiphilus]